MKRNKWMSRRFWAAVWAGSLATYIVVANRTEFVQLALTLVAVREDNQCQYSALFAIIEAQELQLHALKGKKMNGNVDDALTKIQAAKSEIQSRLVQQACK